VHGRGFALMPPSALHALELAVTQQGPPWDYGAWSAFSSRTGRRIGLLVRYRPPVDRSRATIAAEVGVHVHRMSARIGPPARCPVVRELRAWPVEHVEAARIQLLRRNAMQWHLEPLPQHH
jgi:hypothetical protein